MCSSAKELEMELVCGERAGCWGALSELASSSGPLTRVVGRDPGKAGGPLWESLWTPSLPGLFRASQLHEQAVEICCAGP